MSSRTRTRPKQYWVDSNPVLQQGEQAVEEESGFMKLGDGTTPWAELASFMPANKVVELVGSGGGGGGAGLSDPIPVVPVTSSDGFFSTAFAKRDGNTVFFRARPSIDATKPYSVYTLSFDGITPDPDFIYGPLFDGINQDTGAFAQVLVYNISGVWTFFVARPAGEDATDEVIIDVQGMWFTKDPFPVA